MGKDVTVHANQAAVLNALPGSASPSCATVGNRRDVRAGTVAVGNFAAARSSFAQQYLKTEVPQLFLYVIPERAAGTKRVSVTVRRTGSGPAATVVSKSVEDAEQWRYFAVTLPVPKPGTYRLTVNSAGGRGCFVVTFRQ